MAQKNITLKNFIWKKEQLVQAAFGASLLVSFLEVSRNLKRESFDFVQILNCHSRLFANL